MHYHEFHKYIIGYVNTVTKYLHRSICKTKQCYITKINGNVHFVDTIYTPNNVFATLILISVHLKPPIPVKSRKMM